MVERREPILLKEAIQKVMNYQNRGEVEFVPIEQCDWRFLGEPLIADHDVPRFDRSPYDGFALRAEDIALASSNRPVKLKVIDEIAAGQVNAKQVGEKEAVRIMTGAAIPNGANAVMMLEHVKENGETYITVNRPLKKNDNISFQGEETKKGDVLIATGTRINPGVKALLATFGYAQVPVVKKPLVGVIATGSELLKVDEPLQPGKIRNSNGYMIESQVFRAGGKVKTYDDCQDDIDSLFRIVQTAIHECDFVITTGGVSVGDFDYLPIIYERLGAQLLFNKIAMRPGSVTSAAEINGKLLFGLSGNPSACYVGFELFVRPYIRYWLYSSRPYLRKGKASLQQDFPKRNPYHRFVRSKLNDDHGKRMVLPVGLDKSNVVSSLAWADCLMVLPKGTGGYKKGDLVDVLLLEDQTGSEDPWMEVTDF